VAETATDSNPEGYHGTGQESRSVNGPAFQPGGHPAPPAPPGASGRTPAGAAGTPRPGPPRPPRSDG